MAKARASRGVRRGGVVSAAVGCAVACALTLSGPAAASSAVPGAGSPASVVAADGMLATAVGPAVAVRASAQSPSPALRPAANAAPKDETLPTAVGPAAAARAADDTVSTALPRPTFGAAAATLPGSPRDLRSAPSPMPGVRPVAPTFVPAGQPPVAVPIAGGAWLAVVAILVAHVVWRRRRDAAEAAGD